MYVFERDAGSTENWGQTAKLTDASAGGSPFSGRASRCGGTCSRSAPRTARPPVRSRSSSATGAALVSGARSTPCLTAPSETAAGPEAFGSAVALDGDLLLVGASSADVSYFGQEDGAAYLFRRDSTDPDQWNFVTRLTAPEATVCTGDRTLAEISLDGPDALEQPALRPAAGADTQRQLRRAGRDDGDTISSPRRVTPSPCPRGRSRARLPERPGRGRPLGAGH